MERITVFIKFHKLFFKEADYAVMAVMKEVKVSRVRIIQGSSCLLIKLPQINYKAVQFLFKKRIFAILSLSTRLLFNTDSILHISSTGSALCAMTVTVL